jgi:peptide/nickel transport system ATP-binding protein
MGLLDVSKIKMYYEIGSGWARAVDDISFTLDRGKMLGIVGESGSGKTSVALTILRLLPPNGRILGGQVILDGVDILKLSADELRKLRWKKMAMIFQGAMNALSPVHRVGDLLADVLRLHEETSPEDAKERIQDLFRLMGIPPSRMSSYPHELSGGMRQRVMIAMSLLFHPDLIIADEPTTALDVITQDRIIQEIKELQRMFNSTVIMITHDISIVAETCDEVAIMYAGQILERGNTISVLKHPSHPYTMALIQAFPSLRGQIRPLMPLAGSSPDLSNLPVGCLFEQRCPIAREICRRERPPHVGFSEGQYSSCHFAYDIVSQKIRSDDIWKTKSL